MKPNDDNLIEEGIPNKFFNLIAKDKYPIYSPYNNADNVLNYSNNNN